MTTTLEDVSAVKPKERRIVTWTSEEDDILREQINIQGTENWTIVASKFKDKTTRQCRRRWFTYLNSDFKKGGWSPAEDMLLCEAQKIFGNRWTEIAKVVSGRTDNAVKNRFTTLCKKRAKREALAKENNNTFINVNSKRVLSQNGYLSQGMVDMVSPPKKLRRAHISNAIADSNPASIFQKEIRLAKQQLRPPFAVLAQNVCKDNNLIVSSTKEGLIDDNKKTEGAFLRKDDPKVAASMQQAELLSSLDVKANMENSEQSLENAWKVLQTLFGKGEEIQHKIADMDLELDDLKSLMEDLRSNKEGIFPSQRLFDIYDSPSSSEYSTGSTILSTTGSEHGEHSQTEICTTTHEDFGVAASQSIQLGDSGELDLSGNKVFPCMKDQEFSSPVQVTPLFGSVASTIPSPQFSESERHFLLKTLGIDSPAPTCRKAILQGF